LTKKPGWLREPVCVWKPLKGKTTTIAREPDMNPSFSQSEARLDSRFELRFNSLFRQGQALSFPCDAQGQVDLDALSDRLRLNYFYAHTLIGRDFSMPAVLPQVPLN
jgi:hypothetical protein